MQVERRSHLFKPFGGSQVKCPISTSYASPPRFAPTQLKAFGRLSTRIYRRCAEASVLLTQSPQ
jgi:hypothetical protein